MLTHQRGDGDQSALGARHVGGHGELGLVEQFPECGRLLGAPAGGARERVPRLHREGGQGRRGGLGAEEGPGTLGRDVAADLARARVVLLQRGRELVHEAGLVPHQPGVVSREEF